MNGSVGLNLNEYLILMKNVRRWHYSATTMSQTSDLISRSGAPYPSHYVADANKQYADKLTISYANPNKGRRGMISLYARYFSASLRDGVAYLLSFARLLLPLRNEGSCQCINSGWWPAWLADFRPGRNQNPRPHSYSWCEAKSWSHSAPQHGVGVQKQHYIIIIIFVYWNSCQTQLNKRKRKEKRRESETSEVKKRLIGLHLINK